MRFLALAFFAIALICVAVPGWAQGADSAGAATPAPATTPTILHLAEPEIQPKAQPAVLRSSLAELAVNYGDHLFADGDYYCAITEYRRYLYLTKGGGEQALRAAMAIGEAYLRSRQLDAAASQFESVAAHVPDNRARAVALLSAGRAHLLNDKLLLAAARLSDARAQAQADSAVAQEALYLLAWARLLQEDWETARSAFDDVAHSSSARATAAAVIVAQLDTRGDLDQKNPLIAMGLSLIPGLGHMYLGQWSVGLAAFTWNALFIFGTGWSIYTQEWGVAAVLGVFELSWFSGTMFGALNGAMRYNRDMAANWIDEIIGAQGRSREIPPVADASGRPGDLLRLLAPLP